MRIFWHFLKRDTQSNVFAWSILVAMSVIYLSVRVLDPSRANGLLTLILLGCYLLFSLVYLSNVWDAGQWSLAAIRRAYLQSLPVSRARMFWICFIRAAVGSIPFWCLLVLLPSFPDSAGPRYHYELSMTAGQRGAFTFISALALFSLQLIFCNIYLATEAIQKIAGKTSRFWQYVKWSFLDTILTFLAIWGWVVGLLAILWDGQPVFPSLFVPLLCLGYFLWQLRRTYRHWMWE